MDRRYRSLGGGSSTTKRTPSNASRRKQGSSQGGSSERDAKLWGAVALQQHLSRSVALQGFHGIQAPAPPRPGHLTLAQKMGLVEAPPPAPTEEQWTETVAIAAHRHEARKACSICHEEFISTSTQNQCILDCGHVFHETCIKQFEVFVRKQNMVPSCPVCRKKSYHRRKYVEGTAQVQEFAALRIQAIVRGIAARKQFLKMRLAKDPKFKSDYYYAKLQTMSDGYLAYAAAREKAVDNFLEEIDLMKQKALADMFRPADWERIRHQILARDEDHLECAICMGKVIVDSGSRDDDDGPRQQHQVQQHRHDGGSEDLTVEEDPSLNGGSGPTAEGHQQQPSAQRKKLPSVSMLSCSHCFHTPCIESLERYLHAAADGTSGGGGDGGPSIVNVAGNKPASTLIPRCPVCRSGYVRRLLFEDE